MIKIFVILVIMALIDIALVFAIIRLAKRTDDNMHRFFLDKASLYTPKQEEQISNIEIVENKIDNKTIKPSTEYIVNNEQVASYKNSSFKQEYKDVKEEMNFDRSDVILDVIKQSEDEHTLLNAAFKKINNDFDFDSIYQLSTVDENQQLSILKEVFNENENKILNIYLKYLGKKKFDVTEFFNYIAEQVKLNDDTFYVKTGSIEENYDDLSDDIVTIYDEDIVEGIKVVHKNKLHDYSI